MEMVLETTPPPSLLLPLPVSLLYTHSLKGRGERAPNDHVGGLIPDHQRELLAPHDLRPAPRHENSPYSPHGVLVLSEIRHSREEI